MQALLRWAGDECAVGLKAGSMAGTVPGEFALVPCHDAAKVGTDGTKLMKGALRVAADGERLATDLHHMAFPCADVGQVTRRNSHAIRDHQAGEILVLADVIS